MDTSEKVYPGVTCPSCGRQEAIITVTTHNSTFLIHGPEITSRISHPFCAYQENFPAYISSFFSKYHDVFEHLVIGDVNDGYLNITGKANTLDIYVAEAIKQILALTNGYFKHVSFVTDFAPSDTVCPICGSRDFVGSNNYLCCQKGWHYQVSAKRWLIVFLQENGYSVEEVTKNGEPCLNISRPTEIDIKPVYRFFGKKEIKDFPLAEIIYRCTGSEGSERILVIRSQGEYAKDYYPTFLKLMEKVDDLFKVIVKVE